MNRDEKLESLGYSFSKTLSRGAIYQPVVIDGTIAYVSGCVPFDGDKNLASKGKVPSQVSVDDAKKAAALCAANVMRLLHQELGSLERVERILKITGFVNSDPDFMEQHLVINGGSQLFLDVFGDAGWHARSAIGLAALPLGASVEIEAVVKLKPAGQAGNK
ncbi:MAG TPA: RidA family protein [Tepidisphaeraceae bacterium]|jgi:enamine deaminase RidA (YjgF/YER057c/UK114 family)|nr:RidA family protein [Tepidisphaeraceae bacterium]